ncbi:carbohydrate ABC transporter permease [Haloechinothrix sp. LS1_15]|uniref:carbohydrate ABC transporter permease n=1 Tax=Haloechinothrix sp. LS1_15 TaxID=2652248 RepID=UPI002947DBC1|nr:carbohydrate ABC transporter permease [Haloechinothrix sp. LS1_15]MDV6013009.1 carbohydrate ABC transporter permease [Haloechinothrix sp. LS1_15]
MTVVAVPGTTGTTAGEQVPDPPARGLASRLVGWLTGRLLGGLLVVVALFWLMPVLGLLVSSLRSEADNRASGWWTVFTAPAQLTVANYENVVRDEALARSLWNTVLISVPATLLVVVLASLAAYALAWIDFRGRDWLLLGIVAMLVMPIQMALIPIAKLYSVLGMFGSIAGVVLFHVAFGLPFGVFLLRNFFAGIPRDLLEAARMDGASEWVIFRRVVVPVGLPAIASLAIFQFLWVWNDLLVALVFAGQDNQPITVALQSQLRQFGSNIDLLAAGSFLSMMVPLVVFFSLQRYFVQGVLAGSTK